MFRSLLGFAQHTVPSPFLLPPLIYPSPLLFQTDSSFRIYHEAFFRNLFEQYPQGLLPPPLPLPTLNATPAVPRVKELSHFCDRTERTHEETPSTSSSLSNLKIRRRLSCPQCSYTTNRLNNLKRHVQTMHEVLTEPIDCCEQIFISKAHFRAHVNTEHRCGYHCDTCRRTFCRKALLRRHQSIHSGQKAFVCRICSYSTSHKGNLDRHARVHRHNNNDKKELLGLK